MKPRNLFWILFGFLLVFSAINQYIFLLVPGETHPPEHSSDSSLLYSATISRSDGRNSALAVPRRQASTDCKLHFINREPVFAIRAAYVSLNLFRASARAIFPVSAVVIHKVNSLEKTKRLVRHLIMTEVFSEILVWNMDRELKLNQDRLELIPFNPDRLRVTLINEQTTSLEEAKYHACQQASYPVCYYQDSPWDSGGYIKSLYRAFLKSPSDLHTVADPFTAYTDLEWSFSDSQIGLETGFGRLSCGAFFLRQHAHRFLRLVDQFLAEADRSQIVLDVYFTVWMNRIPVQYPVALKRFEAGTDDADPPYFFDRQFQALSASLSILQNQMKSSVQDTGSLFKSIEGTLVRTAWAFCVHDDCLFHTNARQQIQGLPFEFDENGQLNRFVKKHPPHEVNELMRAQTSEYAAVDGIWNTCWNAKLLAGKDLFYGVEWLRPVTLSHVTVVFGHSWELQSALRVEVSMDGVQWTALAAKPSSSDQSAAIITPLLQRPSSLPQCASDLKLTQQPTEPLWTGSRLKSADYVFTRNWHFYRFLRFLVHEQLDTDKVPMEDFMVCEIMAVPMRPSRVAGLA